MPVKQHHTAFRTANRMQLKIHHFARGTFPTRSRTFDSMPVNRFFLVISNPRGESCRLEDSEHSFALKPGAAYFAPRHHNCHFLLDDKVEFISIHFTLELYEGIDIFSSFGEVCEFCDRTWLQRAEKAFETDLEFSAALQLQGIVSDFAALLGEKITDEQWENVTRFASFKKELEYLQNCPPAQVTVDKLAELHGVTRECFSRKFTRITGVSPKRFLTHVLLSHACRKLLSENLSIREIACDLGFSNEFYFSRFFHKHTGLPPKEYRSSILK